MTRLINYKIRLLMWSMQSGSKLILMENIHNKLMIPFGNFSKMFRQAWAKPKFDQPVFLTFNKAIFSCEDSIDRMMQAVLTKCSKKSPDDWNLNRKKFIKSIICHRFVSTVGSVKIICERKVTCSLYVWLKIASKFF